MEKKNVIKINITTFIFTIAIFILIMIGLIYFIIINNKKEDNNIEAVTKNATENTTQNDIPETNNSVYPEEVPEELDIQENTYIAFSKLFNNNNIFLDGEKYFTKYYMMGDFNQQLIEESNYMQYCNSKSSIEKYNDTINIKLVPFDSWLGNCASAEGINYDGNIFEKKIKEIAEYQATIYPKCHDYDQELAFVVTGMLIMNGNNTSENDFYNNSRAKKIKIIFNGTEEEIYELQDTMDIQLITLNYVQTDISKPINIKIEVLESYNGNLTNDIYISDIQFGTYFTGTHGI